LSFNKETFLNKTPHDSVNDFGIIEQNCRNISDDSIENHNYCNLWADSVVESEVIVVRSYLDTYDEDSCVEELKKTLFDHQNSLVLSKGLISFKLRCYLQGNHDESIEDYNY